jgi:antibiotic biosynthesis monooxygenase (ABM) superfamily enzyme
MENKSKNGKHKMAFIIWLAIYPLITVLYHFLGEYLQPLPTVLRTLVLTVIAVPVMVYLLVPLLSRLFGAWLNK